MAGCPCLFALFQCNFTLSFALLHFLKRNHYYMDFFSAIFCLSYGFILVLCCIGHPIIQLTADNKYIQRDVCRELIIVRPSMDLDLDRMNGDYLNR